MGSGVCVCVERGEGGGDRKASEGEEREIEKEEGQCE